MSFCNIKIYINEKETSVAEGVELKDIREKFYPNSDITILNGFPIDIEKDNRAVSEKDRISFIKKGICPDKDELESLLIARHTPGLHNSLKKGKIAILGLGGLGSNIAISLARVGVGKLIIADFDIVEPSNLNRQNYFISDIGKKKTEATKENIKRANPFIDIETHDLMVTPENMQIFSDADIIIEAFDNPESKARISNYVLKYMKNKCLIASSGMAGYYDSNIIQTKKIRENFYICGDFVHEAREGDGLMAPRVSICANHMANLAVQILADKKL